MLSFIFSIFVMSFSDSSPQKIPKSKEKVEKFIKVPAGKEIQKEFFCLKENDLNLHFRNNNNLKVQNKMTIKKDSGAKKEKHTNKQFYLPEKIPKQENKIL